MFRLRAWQAHATIMMLLACILVYFQSYVLARAGSPWLHIDLASVFVVYVAIEHLLLGALIRIFVVAALMHMFSGAPDGFYLMYFLLALVLANLLAKFFALHKLSSQALIFLGIIVLKYALIYASLDKTYGGTSVWNFAARVSPSLIVTTLLAVPLFAVFSSIDQLFDGTSRRDHRQELVEK
jgi:hypothetical protein